MSVDPSQNRGAAPESYVLRVRFAATERRAKTACCEWIAERTRDAVESCDVLEAIVMFGNPIRVQTGVSVHGRSQKGRSNMGMIPRSPGWTRIPSAYAARTLWSRRDRANTASKENVVFHAETLDRD